MTNQKIFTPLFASLAFAITLLFLMINKCTQVANCALVFSLLILIANFTVNLYGAKKTILIGFFAMISSLLLMNNVNYLVNGRLFSGLIKISLISVFCSLYVSVKIMEIFGKKLENKLNLQINLVGLIVASLIDATIMSIYFANYFSLEQIISLAATELTFKLIYALTLITISSLMISFLSSSFGSKNCKRVN